MSVIYKIYCKDPNIKDCYIGSTKLLNRRKTNHKSNYNNINSPNYNDKVYKFIRANGGFTNFDFEILETFETIINKTDLLKIEGQYIKTNNATLNMDLAGRTLKEYYQDNKKKKLEYAKKYRADNKEKIQEYKQKYNKVNYEKNKEKLTEKVECIFCKSLITYGNIGRHQQTEKCKKIQNTNQNQSPNPQI